MMAKLFTIRTSATQALRGISSAVLSLPSWVSNALSRMIRRISSIPRALRIRLTIALLKMLQRIIGSGALRFVLRPLLMIWLYAWVCRLAFGGSPIKVASGSAIKPEFTEMIAKLEASRRARVRGPITAEAQGITRTMTWGTAGLSVLILLQIATSTKALGSAMLFASVCFAITIPLLVMLQFAYAQQWDPLKEPPTTQELINLTGLIYVGQAIFAIGLASLFWSIDVRVAIAFLVACCFSLRLFKKFVVQHLMPTVAANDSALFIQQGSGESGQAPTHGPTGGASTASPAATKRPTP